MIPISFYRNSFNKNRYDDILNEMKEKFLESPPKRLVVYIRGHGSNKGVSISQQEATPGTWGPQDVWNLIWDWDYTPDPVIGQHRIGWKKLFRDFSGVGAKEVVFLITSCQNMVHETWDWTHRLSRTNNYETWLAKEQVLELAEDDPRFPRGKHREFDHRAQARPAEMYGTPWRIERIKT